MASFSRANTANKNQYQSEEEEDVLIDPFGQFEGDEDMCEVLDVNDMNFSDIINMPQKQAKPD